MGQITFQVVRGQQAGTEYYTTMVRYDEAIKLFNFIEEDDDTSAKMRSQRKVSNLKVKNIDKYIKDKPKTYILPALTAEIYSDMEFIPVNDDSNVGELIFDLEDGEKIGLTDGQHRLLGVRLAVERNPELKNETFAITIYPYQGLKLSQQRFSDINSKSTKVSKNLNITYNDDDAIAKVTNSYFKRPETKDISSLIEYEHLSPSKTKLLNIKDFYNGNKLIMGVLSKQNVPYIFQQGLLNRFWDCVFKKMTIWEESLSVIKKDTIAAHSITIGALSIIGSRLFCDEEFTQKMDMYKNIKFVDDYLDNKLDKLSEFDFYKNNQDIIDVVYFNGKLVNNKQVKKMLADTIYLHLDF